MKRDVFISYSRKNFDEVASIKKQIDDATGAECWMDLKGGIEAGSARYDKDIIEGINACKVSLFMLSKESQESENAIGEIDLAKAKKKRIVLVNIDNCELNDYFILHYGRADIIYWQNAPQREKLLRDVKRWIGDNKPITTPPPVTTPSIPQQKDPLQEMHESIVQSAKEMREKYKGSYVSIAKWDNGKLTVGSVTVPGRWERNIYAFSGVVMRVRDTDRLYGLVDTKGRLVIPDNWPKMEDSRFYGEGLIPVGDIKGMWGYANVIGGTIPCQWKWAGKFNEGLAPVENNDGRIGYIDKSGNLVIPYQWKQAGMFSSTLAFVQDENGKWGCIDHDGRLVIPCIWNDFRGNFGVYVKGQGVVKDDSGLWGLIDKSGRLTKPCQWTMIGLPKNDRTLIEDKDGKFGYLDYKSGEIAVQCKWDKAKDFFSDICEVKDSNGKWWKIDKDGKVVGEA